MEFKVHYSLLIDDDPKFRYQALVFINTLISSGINPKNIFVNLVYLDHEFSDHIKNIGVNVCQLDKFGDKKYCNKISQFNNKSLQECDYIFLCDCDIAFINNLDQLALQHRDKIIGKTVDTVCPPINLIEDVSNIMGVSLSQVPKADVYNGKTLERNLNGGLLGIPKILFDDLGKRWKLWAELLLDNAEISNILGDYSIHIDQISFLFSILNNDKFQAIDSIYNFPIHSEEILDFVIGDGLEDEIYCLHYHNKINQYGMISYTGEVKVDKYIDLINKVIKEIPLNNYFWDFRYKYYPTLGSGIGSRDIIKEKKVQLFRNLGLSKFESVLDVGCGDGVVLKTFNINDYTGIDYSSEAIRLHRSVRPNGKFLQVGLDNITELPESSLVLCIDVLIHQTSIEDFENLLNFVVSKTSERLIISGYSDFESLDSSHMCYYYGNLKEKLIATGHFSDIYEVSRYDNITVYCADTSKLVTSKSVAKNDFGIISNNLIEAQNYDDLKYIVSTSRSIFGWYTKHLPRIYEYPWILRQVGKSSNSKVIAEFGAGLSALPFILAERGAKVITIDAGPDRTKSDLFNNSEWGFFDYNSIEPNVKSYNTNLTSNTLPNNSIDIWYSVSVIEHLPASVRREILSAISKSLKIGGEVLLTVDLEKGSSALWNYSEGQIVDSHIYHGSLSTLMTEMERFGIEVVDVDTMRMPDTERVDIAKITAVKTFDLLDKAQINSHISVKALFKLAFGFIHFKRFFAQHDFDEVWYASKYSDVYNSKISPKLHYYLYGFSEGRRGSWK